MTTSRPRGDTINRFKKESIKVHKKRLCDRCTLHLQSLDAWKSTAFVSKGHYYVLVWATTLITSTDCVNSSGLQNNARISQTTNFCVSKMVSERCTPRWVARFLAGESGWKSASYSASLLIQKAKFADVVIPERKDSHFFVQSLCLQCDNCDSFYEILKSYWSGISKRDWTANDKSASPVACFMISWNSTKWKLSQGRFGKDSSNTCNHNNYILI